MGDLGTLGGTQSEARGINNYGHVIGSAALSGDVVSHAFLYKNGAMTDLGTLAEGSWSWAYGINDADQVVGASYYSAAHITHAFLSKDVGMTDLTPSPTYSSGTADDINNYGQIVGTAAIPYQDSHAFLYSGGVIVFLGVLAPGGGGYGTGISEAFGINNSGQIVGYSTSTSGNCAFLYESGVMTDLNTLIPSGPGWQLNYAVDINDNGRIAGIGTINSQSHAFLMVPKTP